LPFINHHSSFIISVMRRTRIVGLLVLVVLAGAAGYLVLNSLGFLDASSYQVSKVPEGDQEIAWIQGASNSTDWGQFLAQIDAVDKDSQKHGPVLHVDKTNAFPSETAAVPEVALWYEGESHKVWIRWYKLSSQMGPGKWVEALAARGKPPLAVLGGDSS